MQFRYLFNIDQPRNQVVSPEPFPAAPLSDFHTVHSYIRNAADNTKVAGEHGDELCEILVPTGQQHAYWPIRLLQNAQLGKVSYAKILERIPSTNKIEPPQWRVTEHDCAIKIMLQSKISAGGADDPHTEINAMRHMQEHAAAIHNHTIHDNCTIDDMRNRAEFYIEQHHVMTHIEILNNVEELCIVMPYCDGREMSEITNISELEARKYMLQLLDMYDFLQGAEVCHRDLSLENILITRNRQGEAHLVMIDFGMCSKIPYVSTGGQRGRCMLSRRFCGKLSYMAPEVLVPNTNASVDAHAIDVWALGPILFCMLCGYFPWYCADDSNLRFRLMCSGNLHQIAEHWELTWSDNVKHLLQNMFWKDPRHRLSLQQIRAHPWFQG